MANDRGQQCVAVCMIETFWGIHWDLMRLVLIPNFLNFFWVLCGCVGFCCRYVGLLCGYIGLGRRHEPQALWGIDWALLRICRVMLPQHNPTYI